jgi:hypothetical protein
MAQRVYGTKIAFLFVEAAAAAASGGLLSFGLSQKKVTKEKLKSGV